MHVFGDHESGPEIGINVEFVRQVHLQKREDDDEAVAAVTAAKRRTRAPSKALIEWSNCRDMVMSVVQALPFNFGSERWRLKRCQDLGLPGMATVFCLIIHHSSASLIEKSPLHPPSQHK